MTSNPWVTTSTQTVYENPWISVREDKVLSPDKKPGIYGVVHFKNRAIGILPVDQEGNIYLVGQWRYCLSQYSWEIPAGGCPENEEPLAAAQRELLEETGLSAKEWLLMGRCHLSNCVSDEEAFIYLATDLTQGKAVPEGTEVFEYKKVSLAVAAKMVVDCEITDAISQMAIMQYQLRFPPNSAFLASKEELCREGLR